MGKFKMKINNKNENELVIKKLLLFEYSLKKGEINNLFSLSPPSLLAQNKKETRKEKLETD